MSGTLAADLGGGSPLPTIFPAVAPIQPPTEARGEVAAAVGLERGRDGGGRRVAMGRAGQHQGKEKKANRFFSITSGMVGNFTPTLSAPGIGEVPLEELQKKVGVELIF